MAVVRGLCAASIGGLLWAVPLAAQTAVGTISGRVVDSTSQQPLSNVTVSVGTNRGALTRADGSYIITNVPAGTYTVRAARIGYGSRSQSVAVTGGATVTANFTLTTVASQLTEVVVTGYGTQRREAITGAVATVSADTANVGVVVNANQLLTARVAGVNVTANNGEPGGGVQIRIRGGTSISASNEPLYVIDGVPITNDQTAPGGIGVSGGSAALPRSPLNTLNPNDIASITVLKDASATAIYGSRGANGVVLIETKKGSAQGTFEYEGFVSAAQAANQLDFLSGNEYRSYVQSAIQSGELRADRAPALGTANTDWFDALTRNARSQQHNLAFSGGSAATQYRASLNFLDNQGVVISNGLQRYQGRLNANHQALDGKLRLGLNLTSARVNNDYLPFDNTAGFEGGVFTNVAIFNPTQPVRLATGQYYEVGLGAQSVRNPVALAEQIRDQDNQNRTLGNLTAGYTLLPNLTASVNVGVDRSDAVRQTYWPRVSPVGAQFNGLARQFQRALTNINFQSLLTYDPKFGENHELDVVGGYEFSSFDMNQFGAETRGFLTDAFGYNRLDAGTRDQSLIPFSNREQSKLVSFFGRANYGFRNRYFVTGVLRYDGSSRLASGNQWSLFPAVSASWRLSEESFLKGGMFSNLSLRVGYGLQGNQAVAPYATQPLIGANSGSGYPFGGNVTTGLAASRNPNPNLGWETSQQANIGLDFALANGRLSGTAEVYQKDTKDLLLEIAVPQPAFTPNRFENIGSLRNRGFEGTLDYNVFDRADRSLTTGLVVTVERNEVTDLGGREFIVTAGVQGQGQSGQNAQRIINGQPLGTFFGPTFVGVQNGVQQFANFTVTRDANGRVTSRVRDGNTTSPDGDDLGIIGNANPSVSLGFRSNLTWKKFDASWLWRAEMGRDVFNNTALVYSTRANVLQGRNFLQSALTQADSLGQPAIYSSRWIENGSFLRLQNVTVGYTFRIPGLNAGRGSSTRVYLSGDNLLLLTPYNGLDPEVFVDVGLAARGVDYLAYPRARTFVTGARIQF